MAIQLIGLAGSGSNVQDVNVGKAAFVTLYDASGNLIARPDQSVVSPGTSAGVMTEGQDYKIARLLRASPSGQLRTSDEGLLFYDSCEGAAVNTNLWVQTTTTMTITQANGITTFNAGNSFATTVGAMQTTHRRSPIVARAALIFRQRAADGAHFNNNLIERGFGNPASATAASVGDGAFWRKDGTGQYVPVLSFNGAENLGTTISNAAFLAAVPAGSYAVFEVQLETSRAKFSIWTSLGVLVSEQWIDFPAAIAQFASTHLVGFARNYNAAATGTAVQTLVAGTTIASSDQLLVNRPWQNTLSALGYNAAASPTAYTQLASYANSAAPANAALSNTAAGYATLGGQYGFAAVAGVETDYALFAIAIPSPYTFYATGAHISLYNTGAVGGAGLTTLQWSLGVGSSAVSLATAGTYPPLRITLGSQSLPTTAAIGQNAPDIVTVFGTPYAVQPGRFVHVILKMPVGSATASQVLRGTVRIDGYFE